MIEACMGSPGNSFLIIADNLKIIISASSVLAAIIVLFLVGKVESVTKKSLLLYSHVILIVFPAVLLTTHTTCGYFCLSCYSDPLHLVSLVIPTTMISSTFVSLLLVPFVLFRLNGSRRLKLSWTNSVLSGASKKLGVRRPDLLVVDKQKPMAFSFRGLGSAIFMSVGMVELFTKKEIEAVILHEMMHIKRGSSALKFSSSFFRTFSPLSMVFGFYDSSKKEEMMADGFAASEQGTKKHLISAKGKIRKFSTA